MFGLDVKTPTMTLQNCRAKFQSALSSLYASREIDYYFKILLAHFFDWEPTFLGLNPTYELEPGQFELLQNALEELKEERPIQQIVGWAFFRKIKLLVGPEVLIPRPETEELVAWILEDHNTLNTTKTIVDIGTGSGCIALSLCLENPNFEVTALDFSPKALHIARQNAETLKAKVTFVEQDIVSTPLPSSYDLMVSNPPYISQEEKNSLAKNVLAFEPHLALFAPAQDPLFFYKAILRQAQDFLNPKGNLYFEINPNYYHEMVTLIKSFSIFDMSMRKDIFGKKRLLRLQKL